jgi:predicted kinase
MAKIILICGKICSGKTRYCKELVKDYNPVILSCDEIESELFHHRLGEKHDEVAKDIKRYLHKKASEIVLAGSNVILDWGFWSREEREQVSEYYKKQNIPYEWHYIDISTDEWSKNINSRNEAVSAGETTDYFVDNGLLEKLNSLFEIPKKEKVDIWYVNQRK